MCVFNVLDMFFNMRFNVFHSFLKVFIVVKRFSLVVHGFVVFYLTCNLLFNVLCYVFQYAFHCLSTVSTVFIVFQLLHNDSLVFVCSIYKYQSEL